MVDMAKMVAVVGIEWVEMKEKAAVVGTAAIEAAAAVAGREGIEVKAKENKGGKTLRS